MLPMAGACLWAETGEAAWLRYEPLDAAARAMYAELPAVAVVPGDSPMMNSARDELRRGVREMLGRTLRVERQKPAEDAIMLAVDRSLPADAYRLKADASGLMISGGDERGVLYGVFALLRRIELHRGVTGLDEMSVPASPIRWTNEWDNLDGSIERGYAGRSIFFDEGHVRADLTRVSEYARLLASIGINGCVISNVNANPKMLAPGFIVELARLDAFFRPWGVRMAISVDFGSPKSIGGLDTFDPLDPRVIAWWKAKVDELYAAVPDLGGFVLKADSEGRVGPSAYGRTHADAANVIARALKPHGGLLFYRGFVYDHHMDWRNLKNDRARAAYDNFHALDGKFDDNVFVQIKYGPIDFQVREPASPLFGGLPHTNKAIELQITQEYTGQQRHLCYLAPMWKGILDFDMHAEGDRATPVKSLVGAYVGVSNVGLDRNWLGHDLAMANLYAFGRLAWNAGLGAREIVDEWTRMTFGDDARVVDTVVGMEMESWPAYEDYTGFLGVGGLTDITGPHFGPGIESSERNGWGQWHRADEHGIGMDRTVATGTGFIGQYSPAVASEFESLEKCPDELLLFMHHVPYAHVLHSGKTLIQHVYDSHYEGAAVGQTFPGRWRALRGRVDDERYRAVLARLEFQAGHAIEWRDAICQWFLKESGIADAHGRAGKFPGRFEAELMKLDGYAVEDVTPWETASEGKAIGCGQAECSATMTWTGKSGWYRVSTRYFDEPDGVSTYRMLVSGQLVDEWSANDHLPSDEPNGHTSELRVTRGIALRTGDELRIEAKTGGKDRADIDYVEITEE